MGGLVGNVIFMTKTITNLLSSLSAHAHLSSSPLHSKQAHPAPTLKVSTGHLGPGHLSRYQTDDLSPSLATPTSHLTGPSLPATSLPGGYGPAPLGAPLACTLVNPDASAVSPAQAWPLLASQPHLNAQPAPPTPPAQHRTPVPPALRPRLLSQALPWGHDPGLKPHSDVGLTPFFS